MSNLFDLSGRIVVVTGGLGQLGHQFATALVAQGARVAVLDVTADAAAIERRYGNDWNRDALLFLACDVTNRSSLEAALAAITTRFNQVPHGLVNNAALDSPPDSPPEENGPFETYPEASWEKVMAVNAKGPFLACQVFGGAMAQAGRGSIVNVASIYGTVSPDQALYQYRRDRGEVFFKPVAYAASKSALYNLTRYLAAYWGGKGVRVNTVTFAGVFNNQDPEFLARYHAKVPLGRMADASEYNGAIIYLMADASSYMTGSNMVIDGGFTAL
ncbi:MAG: SDR family oxidoreductase [Magnetospirillum sp.]|nr:SDR family oxidoreductase [Magnetospirillum sp.]